MLTAAPAEFRRRGQRRFAPALARAPLVAAVGQISERQSAEISQRPRGEDDPRVSDQQRDEQHRHDHGRPDHFGRHAGADALAGKHRQPRHHQRSDGERVDQRHPAQPFGARQAEQRHIDRQQHGDGAGRRRHADEEIAGPGRLVRIVDHHVEAGKPERGADGEHHRGDPARRFQIVQAPEIEDQRRRDAEIDEVGQAVELGAEARGAFEEPRQAAVDAVEKGGEDDRGERQHIAVLERHADRGEAGAERQQRDDVGHQSAHRNAAEAPLRQAQAWAVITGRRHGHGPL